MFNRIIYDCEIIRCIPQRGQENDPAFKYCQGWGDYFGMGISVIGHQFNNNPPEYSLTTVDFDEWVDSKPSDAVVIGFNSLAFDDQLITANGSAKYNITQYDLLCEVRVAAGLQRNDRPRGQTYALGALAEANGLVKGKGVLAPVLWQQGRCRTVIEYCLNDVLITSQILDLGLAGKLVNPNNGKLLHLSYPVV